jgi:hypothetical protein
MLAPFFAFRKNKAEFFFYGNLNLFRFKTILKIRTNQLPLSATWGQCYKTFYGRKLRLFTTS